MLLHKTKREVIGKPVKQHGAISYFAFGGLQVCLQSQTEVMCRLHQVLGRSDQNLIHRACHGPRRLHQRSGLLGKGERKHG